MKSTSFLKSKPKNPCPFSFLSVFLCLVPAKQVLTHTATSPACIMLLFCRSKASVDFAVPSVWHSCHLYLYLFILGFNWGIVFLEKPSLTLPIPLMVSFVFSELPEFPCQSIPHTIWPSSVWLKEFPNVYLLIQLQILAPRTKFGLS